MMCRYKYPYLHQAVPSYAKEDLCIPLPAYHYFTYHYYFLNPYKPLNTNYVFIQKNKNYTLKIDNRLTN